MLKKISSMFKNKDIRNRILFTLAMLFIFRFGAAITVPGVDMSAMTNATGNSLFEMINLLGGGGLEQLSVFALGVGPYITASIIIQLLSMDVIPALTELSKSGASGKKQIDRYTRYLAVVLSFIQASVLIHGFSKAYPSLLSDGAGVSTILYVATVLTGGSMFLLWIGDRITLKGIGNGVSMLICAGIVSRMPHQFITAWDSLIGTTANANLNGILAFIGFIFCYLLIIIFVVFMQTAERKIPIQYTSSSVTTRKKDMTYLPLKINSAGVIPVIFASAIMVAPLTICQMVTTADWVKTLETYLGMKTAVSLLIYVILILLFTFFYTKLQVDPEKISENLAKSGTYIPGVRPGSETKEYINKVLNRITVLGAIGLAFIAVLPHALPLFTSLPQSMGIGGTGIIIVVGVAMETVKQIEGRMTQKSYRGFLQR